MAGFSRTVSASLLFLFLLFGFSAAKELLVGGKIDAWKIPSSEADSLNQWAERSRFHVGDHLVWKYEGGKDSVLEVNREEYGNCSTSNPIKEYSDGNTKVKLDRPGPFYFISGVKGHCEKGQKIIVVVMSPRNRYAGISPSPAPSPAAEFEGPAVAPTSAATALQGALVTALGVLAMYVGFLM
ncbi:early nodulin-like protein 15 [Gastrolobium bilobum]|uniref:early nodulin-like protein 15 n=1 Tax=Gastrolobium bilobum TaxID=150636 RepID=UPI002AB1BC44|nr:early nodulin-like protein 15 [Gastrolobium bilobum]